ncbi:MAG: hypothetical protein ACD_4C00282G0004 [uncultured bacterium (gcode 4)]|uniref:PLD phosphodiesterase domain-containing protein n=1 Tax=uncultured bacterium (gcode 4) TaxID=1234023 RepID=K2G8K2_9BACT|nr:MAG: hypothetical protein ACD_4C00282G0004 [uncultured bacterium (gcode 4)]
MKEQNNHNVELIIDWEQALNIILDCINHAQKTIKIRMYMWRDDASWKSILDALSKKIQINPQIKIFIEKDAFWTRVYNFQKYITFWRLWWDIFFSDHWKDFIKKENIEFKYIWYSSLLLFKYIKENDHSKVYLFDENTNSCKAIIWWMNISDEYLTPQDKNNPSKWGWHDYMVLIKWELTKNININNFKKNKKFFSRKIHEWIGVLMNIQNKQSIRKEILKEFARAKKSIIIEHWYLTDNIIIKNLRKISQKGINVTIIMPDTSDWVYHANMHSIYNLLRPSRFRNPHNKEIEIYLYKWMIHAKVILIDEFTSIIGSANLTNWSFDLLKETNAIFRQKNWITKDLLEQLNKDLENCKRITIWNIPKYNKWLAWFQGIFI